MRKSEQANYHQELIEDLISWTLMINLTLEFVFSLERGFRRNLGSDALRPREYPYLGGPQEQFVCNLRNSISIHTFFYFHTI
jgi:hypothetical protein